MFFSYPLRFMTGVAGNSRAPDVGRVALVSVVYPRPGVASAIRARKNHIVRGGSRGIRVACGADAIDPVMVHVEPGVSKRRPQPTCRVVARGACGWDDSGDNGVDGEVIRDRPTQRRGALPLSGVATIAIQRRRSCCEVAKVAGHRGVRASQGKPGCIVVKDRA
jgi:hypothetical protein